MTTTMNFNLSPTLTSTLTAGGSGNGVYAYAFAFSSGTLVGQGTILVNNGVIGATSVTLPTSFPSGTVYVVIQQGGNGTLPSQITSVQSISPANAQAQNYQYQLFEATLSSTSFDQGDLSSLNTFGLPSSLEVAYSNAPSQTRGFAPGLTGAGIYNALGTTQSFSPNIFPSADRLAVGPAAANNASPWPASDWSAYVTALKNNPTALADITLVVPFAGGTSLQAAPMLSQYGVQYVAQDQYGTDYFWLAPNTMNGATNTDWIRIPASQLMQNIYIQPGPLEVHAGGKDGPITFQTSFTPNDADGAVAKYFVAGFDAGYWGGTGTSPNPQDPSTLDLSDTWNWSYNYAYNATLNSSAIKYSNVLGSGPGATGGSNRFYDPWAQEIQKFSNAYGYSYSDLVSEGGVNPQISLWDTGTNANVTTIRVSLFDNSETLPSTSGFVPSPVPYVAPTGTNYQPALTLATSTPNTLQFAFNFGLGSPVLNFSPNAETPIVFKFYAPTDPTAVGGFVSVTVPTTVTGFLGDWNYMQLNHTSGVWSLTPTNVAGNPGFFQIQGVPVTADGSTAWYQLVFGGPGAQTTYNIYAQSNPTTHNFLDTTLGSSPNPNNFVVDHNVGILEVSNSNYALNFAVGGNITYNVATFSPPNQITGTDANNVLNGTSGNNPMNGGPGNDTINGGAGIDRAISWEPSKNFTVRLAAGDSTITLRDKVGTDGTDSLTSIESIQFRDQTLDTTWITKTAALPVAQIMQVVDLYTAGLNRAPDAVGLDYWASRLADGASIGDISKIFFNSAEAAPIYSSANANPVFVNLAYQAALGRAPDAAGAAYWVNELNTGHIQRTDFVTSLITGARGPGGSAADVAYIASKETVGAHFALTQGLNNVAWARTVESAVNGAATSVTAANAQTDSFAATAATSAGSELVVQILGIVP